MYKSKLKILLAIVLCMVALLTCNVVASDMPVETIVADVDYGASATVENYLQALVGGDIPGLKQTLSLELLQVKEPVLDSIGYDATLRELYAGATYSVVGSQWAASDKIRVDAQIVDGSDNVLEIAFLLVRTADGTFMIDQEIQ